MKVALEIAKFRSKCLGKYINLELDKKMIIYSYLFYKIKCKST